MERRILTRAEIGARAQHVLRQHETIYRARRERQAALEREADRRWYAPRAWILALAVAMSEGGAR